MPDKTTLDTRTVRPLAGHTVELVNDFHAGLRRVDRHRLPLHVDGRWSWGRIQERGPVLPHHLPIARFRWLPPLDAVGRKGAPTMHYDSRSEAFLALAEALAQE